MSEWPVLGQEMDGAEPKNWITAPTAATSESRGQWWLFKPAKFGTRTGPEGARLPYRRSDDLAERVACALAALIDLPAAEVEFARRGDVSGIISRNVTPDGWSIQGGDIALSEIPGYLSCQTVPRPRNRVGHNLRNIRRVLGGAGGPPGSSEDLPAYAVFAGYLIFDAWIANTDRHAMNWAVIDNGHRVRLAPTFDHGSALASGAADDDLDGTDPAAFSLKGFATRFEDGKSRPLVDLALAAVAIEPAAAVWLDRLAAVSDTAVFGAVSEVPGLSVVRRTFMEDLLTVNRRRLVT